MAAARPRQTLLREAAKLIAPYAAEHPERFGKLQQDINHLLQQTR